MATIVEEREPTPSRILKKITPYSVGVKSFEQGDACFSITAFDDYVYFSLTEERDGEEVALDLTGYGSIFLRFKNKDIDISIKAISETGDIDPSKGEAVFKISAADSKRIIATDINNFAIISRLDIGDDSSYENVIFQGKFLKPDESSSSLSRYDQFYNEEEDKLIQSLENETTSLRESLKNLKSENSAIKYAIESLSVQFDELNKKYRKTLLLLKEVPEQIISNPIKSTSNSTANPDASALERPLPTPTAPVSQTDDNIRNFKEKV